MRTPLLLLCVLALLTACDDQQPNTHHRSPRNPPADTSGLQFTDYVRWSSRPYSVDAYLEPNLVFGNWTDYARGEADLFFFTALPPTTASAAAAPTASTRPASSSPRSATPRPPTRWPTFAKPACAAKQAPCIAAPTASTPC